MATSETLSIRLTAETRRILAESASTQNRAGASALAREILERWAAATLAERRRDSTVTAMAFLEARDGDWGDEPSEFFPMPS